MTIRTTSVARVLMTTASTGNSTPYQLITKVPGFQTPSEAGLDSSKTYRVAYLCTDNIYGDPTNWERGIGTLSFSGNIWQIARTIVRRTMSGGTSAVAWPTGTRWVFIALDPDDVAMLNSDGWLALGGDPTRDVVAPLDIVVPLGGAAVKVRTAKADGTLEDLLTVNGGGVSADKQMWVPTPSQPGHAVSRAYLEDAIAKARTSLSASVTSAVGSVEFDIPTDWEAFNVIINKFSPSEDKRELLWRAQFDSSGFNTGNNYVNSYIIRANANTADFVSASAAAQSFGALIGSSRGNSYMGAALLTVWQGGANRALMASSNFVTYNDSSGEMVGHYFTRTGFGGRMTRIQFLANVTTIASGDFWVQRIA